MLEAIFGLIGVLIGSTISWLQSYWTDKKSIDRNARYLAIRVVCILDKFLEDSAAVVRDDGLDCGMRTIEGHLKPQVIAPSAPVFPNDIDWKSIDHELMYKILSFPSDIESAEGIIRAAWEASRPPNFEMGFDERAFWYAQFGIAAYALTEELSKKYSIQKKTYKDRNPIIELQSNLEKIQIRREERIIANKIFIDSVLGKRNK